MILTNGKKYTADLSLGILERLVDNDTISKKLTEAGFMHVTVYGAGAHRTAIGTWIGPTRDVSELPKQVTGVRESQ